MLLLCLVWLICVHAQRVTPPAPPLLVSTDASNMQTRKRRKPDDQSSDAEAEKEEEEEEEEKKAIRNSLREALNASAAASVEAVFAAAAAKRRAAEDSVQSAKAESARILTEVGLYTLTPPDPQLKGAWFQPLHLSSEEPVSEFCLSNATCTATSGSSSSRPAAATPAPSSSCGCGLCSSSRTPGAAAQISRSTWQLKSPCLFQPAFSPPGFKSEKQSAAAILDAMQA